MSTSSFAAELPPAVAVSVDRVWQRIERYRDTHDDAEVLDAETAALADGLWRHAFDHPYGARPDIDPRMAAAIAAIHWLRYQCAAVPEEETASEEEDENFHRAMIMFRHLHDLNPKLVPSAVHVLLHEEDEENGDAEQFNAVGIRLVQRYATTGELAAIDDAVSLLDRAVECATKESVVRARHLTNLCGALLMRFNLRQDVRSLREAVTAGERAVEIRSTRGVERAATQANYGVALVHAADVPGLVDDARLRRAVEQCRGALLSVAPTDPQAAAYRNTLVSVARAVFERTHQWTDLETALALAEELAG